MTFQFSYLNSKQYTLNFLGEATFESTEPGFKLVVKALSRGRVELVVEITPDHIHEQHRFESEIDQSYLLGPIAALKTILADYGPRGEREEL